MNKQSLEQELQNNEAVMVYFSGDDCGVCQALKPKIEALFNKRFPKIKQVFINTQEFRDTAAQYNVLSVPTLLVYFDSKEFLRESRLISVPNIEVKISRTYELFF